MTCQTESAPQSCAGAPAGNDLCGACVCGRCGLRSGGCTILGDPMRSASCSAVVACIRKNSCAIVECYCGPNERTCLAGSPSGPCKAEIELAAGSSNVLEVVAQLRNQRQPLGRALTESACEQRECAVPCRL
jgi:hypothetical protein